METKPEVFTASLKQRTARLKVKPTVHFPCPKEIVFNESVHAYWEPLESVACNHQLK